MAYAHVQMVLYRPFLHHAFYSSPNSVIDKRSYACAAACVGVSRNIIHITAEMKRKGLLIGAYWFTMYTTFFAILSLVFYVLEIPQNVTSQDILREASQGKEILASLANRSMAADRCTKSLTVCRGPFDSLFSGSAKSLSRVFSNSFTRDSSVDVMLRRVRRKSGRLHRQIPQRTGEVIVVLPPHQPFSRKIVIIRTVPIHSPPLVLAIWHGSARQCLIPNRARCIILSERALTRFIPRPTPTRQV